MVLGVSPIRSRTCPRLAWSRNSRGMPKVAYRRLDPVGAQRRRDLVADATGEDTIFDDGHRGRVAGQAHQIRGHRQDQRGSTTSTRRPSAASLSATVSAVATIDPTPTMSRSTSPPSV